MREQEDKLNPIKMTCISCRKPWTVSTKTYYEHNNQLVGTKYYPLCKTCIGDYLGEKDNEKYISRVKEILQHLNRPWIYEQWVKSNSDWGRYVRHVSSLNNGHKTFMESEFETEKIQHSVTTFEIEEDARRFWRGYSDEEIDELEYLFSNLTDGYESESLIQETLLKQIAVTQMKANHSTNTKEYTDLISTLSKLMNDANIKPTQKSNTNQSEEIFGAWIKKIEDEEPIPEPLEEFKDVDKVKKYLNKYFINHFAKLFGLKDVKSKE
ncbi:hypothetical protein [Paenibacillus sp. O199]|uniref:hypothetical protein n=1 Tax=Paenibacillus sp. O199 TaxID=1643925 RepID=UPI0007BEF598|nr:hypothetical protein [Paenibacillus sp. O199]